MALPAFDPDFASPSDWAAMYRAVGLQVVPARYPMRDRTDKRPALANWREFQNDLAPQAVFDRWYGWPAGEHARTPNMGVVSGAASGNTIVIDLDEHSKADATWWWRGLLELHNHGGDVETWCQVTGGGGRQLFFRAPADWHAPTNRTPIGVDIRGQGGFAMLPPSIHLSGKEYAWAPGYSPWETDLADAPQWLLDAVDDLVLQHGGDTRGLTQVAERTDSPATDFDPFGARIDGREDAMTRLVWGSVVGLHRATAGSVSEDVAQEHFDRALQEWLRKAKTRLTGVDNAIGLERECRGASMFLAKWQRAMKRWETKVAADARVERVAVGTPATAVAIRDLPASPLEYLDIAAIRALPDPRWMVENLIIEDGLGFIYGPPGHGKTFVALSLALHVAYSMTHWWWGKEIERKGLVVYVAREGVAGLKGRIAAWQQANGILDDSGDFVLVRAGLNFMVKEDVANLLATIEAASQAKDAVPALIFVDTVSRVMPGADENLQKEMTLFVEACSALKERYAATVVGVHHAGKGGDMRGSTVLLGAGDFVFRVEKHDVDDKSLGVCFWAEKIKDDEDGWKHTIDLKPVEWVEEGKIDGTRRSLVATPRDGDEPASTPKGDAWPDKPTCRKVLDAIRDAWMAGAPWSSYPQAKRDGRFAPAKIQSQFGVSAATAANMLEAWLTNDILSVEVFDKRSGAKALRVCGSID